MHIIKLLHWLLVHLFLKVYLLLAHSCNNFYVGYKSIFYGCLTTHIIQPVLIVSDVYYNILHIVSLSYSYTRLTCQHVNTSTCQHINTSTRQHISHVNTFHTSTTLILILLNWQIRGLTYLLID